MYTHTTMNTCAEQRSMGVASTSRPTVPLMPCRGPCFRGQAKPIRGRLAHASQLSQETLLASGRTGTNAGSGALGRLAQHETSRRIPDEESALPLYACLDGDILTPANKFAYYEALRSGLKALRALGINGISVDVYWGIVEGQRPGEYDWSAYKQLFALIRDEGFMAQVCLCFHGSDAVPLPAWVVAAGRANPDIFYSDRAGGRCCEYVSLGADEVPVLCGRTPLGCYRDLMLSFRRELGELVGDVIVDVTVGLGPDGELKYPAHPRDKRWTFPGVGEFQCYDKYMLSVLRACALQVDQPSWGLGGPHDAGSYCVWPSQTGFFHHQRGNWGSPYGRFFLQWYGDMLVQHADAVLGTAREVLVDGCGAGRGGGGGGGRGVGGASAAAGWLSSSTSAYYSICGASNGSSSSSYGCGSSSSSGFMSLSSSMSNSSSYGGSNGVLAGNGNSRASTGTVPWVAPGLPAMTAPSTPASAAAWAAWQGPPPTTGSPPSATSPWGSLYPPPSFSPSSASPLLSPAPPSPSAPVRLHAKLPGLYWWYNTASHAPELTAGYYNTANRDGYLPVMQVLARHGVSARLRSAELRSSELAPQACCDPERLIAAQRTAAAALHVPVGLENGSERFDDGALGRLESALFDTSTQQGIELPQVQSLVFSRMCDSMFEPANWGRFKDFVRRVRNRADTLVVPPCRGRQQVRQQQQALLLQQQQQAAAAAARQQQQQNQ
ncbi:hypothetical protein Agub_g14684 [Astrephomene gubernaculifera]|uniref:Beta-amylase n=1 Tax=Astrephomene gubernaculifera TaxID=47775 RepID=A0AAD3E615_9CHLO|nr:hypothetical protein Agub_g14684 [Astrephomene gubernaculifera]